MNKIQNNSKTEKQKYLELVNDAPVKEPDRQQYFIGLLRTIMSEKSVAVGRKFTYHIETFGCPTV